MQLSVQCTLRESSEEEWAESMMALVSIKSYWCSSVRELQGFCIFCDVVWVTDVQCFSYLAPTLTLEQRLIQHIQPFRNQGWKTPAVMWIQSHRIFSLSSVECLCSFLLMDSLWRRWEFIIRPWSAVSEWVTHLSRPCKATVTAAQRLSGFSLLLVEHNTACVISRT